MRTKSNKNNGMALLVVIVLVGFMIVMASVFASHFHRARLHHLRGLRAAYALNYAEAGISKALWELSKPGSAYKGESDTPFGNGLFTVDVEDVEGKDDLKLVRATGKAYSVKVPAKTEKRFTKTVEATVQITNHAPSASGKRKVKILNWKKVE